MNTIQRDHCVVTGEKDLEKLHCMKDFPLFMGCTTNDPSMDILVDMEWSISKSSGLIQLSNLIPLDVLYAESHGAGSVGRAWQMHHDSFAQFINQYSPQSVLEIGGGHGILSKSFHSLSESDWVIVEPNPTPESGVKAKYIEGFFDEHFSYEKKVDAIVHSHVFEHIYFPQIFIEHISSFAQDGDMHIFSVPNMMAMLERHYTNCINFEHTLFLTEPYIEYLLAKTGFRIIKKQHFMEDHSLFYSTVKDSSVQPIQLSGKLYALNRNVYNEFVKVHLDVIQGTNSRIKKCSKPVYLFGAHIFAQYLIGFGLDVEGISCILDNDPNKQGKRLYGCDLQVESPKILKDVNEPVIILKAGIYNEEIKADIINNINNRAEFWE
jgi:2-polyprenyl-3-methyl-5-hydroxy-6-metoxy-1,4-benzoquinol methylase